MALRPVIVQEIKEAFDKGLFWTPWRAWLDRAESLGALGCGTRPRRRKCKKIADYVKYTTGYACPGIMGRVSICHYCLSRDEPDVAKALAGGP